VDIATVLEQERLHVDREIERHLPAEGEYPERIHQAIRYSVLNGGKRLRPIIALAAARALGHDGGSIMKAACSIEYVHCCSLVLDDLPSMDNAEMRRGRPATHRAFGVATGILAADALLMHAFKLVADNGVEVRADGATVAAAVRDLATAVGSYGMVGGQHVDLEVAGGDPVDRETLEYIQTRKTGALFVVAATIGGTLLGVDPERREALREYAGQLGLAYQIVDDILDAVADAEAVGKDVRKDVDKASFVTVHGVEDAREAASRLIAGARSSLRRLDGDASVLDEIAVYCLERSR
jgi:geranylgeranyl diphosphate synthase type II